jgi:hypothetical protein
MPPCEGSNPPLVLVGLEHNASLSTRAPGVVATEEGDSGETKSEHEIVCRSHLALGDCVSRPSAGSSEGEASCEGMAGCVPL